MQRSSFSTSQQQSRKEQTIASILGQPSYQAIDWRTLMQKGVLVKLTVRRCRFTARLQLADLGITIQDERVRSALRKTLILGEKRLLPEAYMLQLERIESGARRSLKIRSFQTQLGAFLPAKNYDMWRAEIEGFQERYLALRDDIVSNYREITSQVLSEYEVIARDTYKRLQGVQPDVFTQSEDQFATDYCNQIAQLIPSPEHVKESFALEYRLIRPVEQMEVIDGAMGTEDEETAVVRMRRQAEQALQESALLEQDLRRQAQQEKKIVIDSFLSALVGQMRELLYEATTDVLATIQSRGDGMFSPRSVVQLKNLIAQLKLLDFYGDQEIEVMLSRVQAVVDMDPAARRRSLGDIANQLRAIATVTRATLLDLEEDPRSAREVAIPEYPTETSVRTARLTLGLDTAKLAEVMTQTATLRQARLIEPPLSLWQKNGEEASSIILSLEEGEETQTEEVRARRLA